MSVAQESKQLAVEIRENEEKYISGELDLTPALDKTDELFIRAVEARGTTAAIVLGDSELIDIQTQIARKCVISHSVDTLVFDPRKFAINVRNKFLSGALSGDDSVKNPRNTMKIWEKLGEYSKTKFHAAPTFSYMYGTFDAVPVERIKKERKKLVRDKVAALTKPETVKTTEQDSMMKDVYRILRMFYKEAARLKQDELSFYHFVTDPGSFTRTVENIFHVTLLIRECKLSLYDKEGMPFLKLVTDTDLMDMNDEAPAANQCILSLSMDDWQEIVRRLDIQVPMIPPRIRKD